MTEPQRVEQAFDADTQVVAYERSPLDVFRVLLFTTCALVVVLLTRYLRTGMDGLEENISSLLSFEEHAVRVTLDSLLISATALTALATMIVPLATRRWRLFGYVFVANFSASITIAAINAWVGDLDTVGSTEVGSDGVALDMSTDVAAATQVVAAFIALAPFVSARWRRAGGWLVAVMLVLRLSVANGASTHVLIVLTVGSAVGSAVLLAFGRPTTQPRASAIAAALGASGLAVKGIDRASVDARGSVPWFATLDSGAKLFVKVLGTNQRAADLMFRVYRMLRLRNVGDERPFSSLRRTVEHEALVALNARDVGVRTPRMRAMSAVGGDGFLLAYDMIDGASLDSIDPVDLTDDVLGGIWSEVGLMQRHRIAHRDLRLANVFLARASGESGASPEPWIIDFGFSEIAADEHLLNADVAQLLASLALVVGSHRAVAPAVEALGTERVAASLTRLQPAALSGSTQSALKENTGLLEELRHEIERTCAVSEVELEPVTRFGTRQLLTLAGLIAVVYFLAPQLANLEGVFGELDGADWSLVVPILAAVLVTYFAAGFALMGSVPAKLPAVPTFAAQVGSSYAGKVAPAGLGGMALNLRYLQKQGLATDVSTSSVGLDAMAGVLGHLGLVVVFVVWAARQADGLALADPTALLIGLAVVIAVGLLALAVGRTRRAVSETLVPTLATATVGLRAVMRQPGKLFLLMGGSVVVTLAYTSAFVLAARVFNIEQSFAVLAAVYVLGAAVAAVAPTPGGLGAVEAALIAGLIAVGVEGNLAVPAVFLFRIATFWLPIAPGWVAFAWLRRSDRL